MNEYSNEPSYRFQVLNVSRRKHWLNQLFKLFGGENFGE